MSDFYSFIAVNSQKSRTIYGTIMFVRIKNSLESNLCSTKKKTSNKQLMNLVKNV